MEAIKPAKALIRYIKTIDTITPYKGTYLGMLNVGRKLTIPIDFSIKTIRLIMAYVIRNNMVIIGATRSRFAITKVISIGKEDKRIAFRGTEFIFFLISFLLLFPKNESLANASSKRGAETKVVSALEKVARSIPVKTTGANAEILIIMVDWLTNSLSEAEKASSMATMI